MNAGMFAYCAMIRGTFLVACHLHENRLIGISGNIAGKHAYFSCLEADDALVAQINSTAGTKPRTDKQLRTTDV